MKEKPTVRPELCYVRYGEFYLDELCQGLTEIGSGLYAHAHGEAYTDEEREALSRANIAVQKAVHAMQRAGVWDGSKKP